MWALQRALELGSPGVLSFGHHVFNTHLPNQPQFLALKEVVAVFSVLRERGAVPSVTVFSEYREHGHRLEEAIDKLR